MFWTTDIQSSNIRCSYLWFKNFKHVYKKIWSNFHQIPSISPLPNHVPSFDNFFHPVNTVKVPICAQAWGHSVERRQPASVQTPQNNDSPFTPAKNYQEPLNEGQGLPEQVPHPCCCSDWINLAQVMHGSPQLPWVPACNGHSMSGRQHVTACHSTPSCSLTSFPP